MSNVGQQILQTEGEITQIATGAVTLVNLAMKAIDAWRVAHPNAPVPEAWDDPVLAVAIATLKNDSAALEQHARDVAARQQALLDAEAGAPPK